MNNQPEQSPSEERAAADLLLKAAEHRLETAEKDFLEAQQRVARGRQEVEMLRYLVGRYTGEGPQIATVTPSAPARFAGGGVIVAASPERGRIVKEVREIVAGFRGERPTISEVAKILEDRGVPIKGGNYYTAAQTALRSVFGDRAKEKATQKTGMTLGEMAALPPAWPWSGDPETP